MKTKMKRGLVLLTALACLFMSTEAKADKFWVKVRDLPGSANDVKVEIKTENIQNQFPGSGGICAMLVPGLIHQGDSVSNLAVAMFTNSPIPGVRIKKVIALNLPGRGGSGLPVGNSSVKLGHLDIENDYAKCLLGALEHHDGDNTPPTLVFGHSMAGQIIQSAQVLKLQNGCDLTSAFGIELAVIKASGSPAEVLDQFLEDGNGLGLISLFSSDHPTRGPIVVVPTVSDDGLNFLGFFFANFSGNLAPGTPSVGEIDAFIKSDDSQAAATQVLGMSAMRPSVPAGAFAPGNGPRLIVMVGNNDVLNDPEQHRSLYRHLTGDLTDSDFIIVEDEFAVHDQFISDPNKILDALRAHLQ